MGKWNNPLLLSIPSVIIGAKFSIIMIMTGYYNFELISISSTLPNKQNILSRRCRSDLEHHSGIVFSVSDFRFVPISRLITLPTQIVSLCTLRDFVYVCPHIYTVRWIMKFFFGLPIRTLQNFNCLQYR